MKCAYCHQHIDSSTRQGLIDYPYTCFNHPVEVECCFDSAGNFTMALFAVVRYDVEYQCYVSYSERPDLKKDMMEIGYWEEAQYINPNVMAFNPIGKFPVPTNFCPEDFPDYLNRIFKMKAFL